MLRDVCVRREVEGCCLDWGRVKVDDGVRNISNIPMNKNVGELLRGEGGGREGVGEGQRRVRG